MKYDLEERCSVFWEHIIDLITKVPRNIVTRPIISQLIRSSTSIWANYMEANQASSPRDFKHKANISKKEANESKHWIRMLARACPWIKEKCLKCWNEANELTKIFYKIVQNTKV